ncbi:GNAT family N-acetyltransferase [Candidatus Persebacteraceae bacterium Df01]|jgi:RimJ/RimL family protein N-acetyltransferase|uniref:GNAT family N-acetyltransferase n=1 Tax=Candidatus Doriopsillibacter californiensis TaxID=2970740 RepID=A0ABT7QJT5_9GAMM|nr:GNAT family N-acetyltransferase [Candidatus Persebacteraceae bacterium Df01]
MTYQLNSVVVTSPPPSAPAPTILRGKYITLEPLTNDGALFERLYDVSHGDVTREKVWYFLPYGSFASAKEMRCHYVELSSGKDPMFYAVRHHDDEQVAGIVSYLRIQPAARSIEIGHIWHATARQRGRANTEAVFLLIKNAFALGYRRLEWKCNALNVRSRQAALRLGLAFEGVFRQCTVVKGKNRDTAWFALLDVDWLVAQQNMEQWLEAPLGEISLTECNLPLVKWSLPAHDAWAVSKTV